MVARSFLLFRLFITLFLMSVSCQVHAQTKLQHREDIADWTIFIFMEAANNLENFAVANLNDMARIGSIPGKLNICVQWNQFNKTGTWRYRVGKGKVELVEHLESGHTGNCVKDLVDGATWAFNTYKSRRKALFFWNHGVGCLDPVWGRVRSRMPQGDLLFANKMHSESEDSVELKGRGILFDEKNKTYMTNQQMIDALSAIRDGVLGGKKIDLIGMDACLMAMLEVCYQIQPFATMFVGSQEVEYAQGWAYSAFLADMAARNLSPMELAHSIVLNYDAYYKQKNYIYTQSAVNLEQIEYIKQNVDQVVSQIGLCTKQYGVAIKGIVQEARRACLHFNTPSYIDLHSFYGELLERLKSSKLKTMREGNDGLPAAPSVQSTHIENLKAHLAYGMQLIEAVVIANVTSNGLKRARGISIYYPRYRLDKSYYRTEFAKSSLWLEFLQEHG